MTRPVQFRPHHFLCALGFQGKGYSGSFTQNMAAIVAQLRGPDGGDTVIKVTAQADSICTPCPHRRGQSCVKVAQIAALDDRHAQALGLHAGQRLTWSDAKSRIRTHVPPGSLSDLCAGCQWLEFGLCEAALSELHRG
ncbi:MAG: DUF1284 domain-containing protein [Rhodobacteraceae bacterium]|nr:DUF1284 domain-containing protein [Paracoccaceae bacterium]